MTIHAELGRGGRGTCLLCGSDRVSYKFLNHGNQVFQCKDCGLLFLDPLQFANPDKSKSLPSSSAENDLSRLDRLLAYGNLSKGSVLYAGAHDLTSSSWTRPGLEIIKRDLPGGASGMVKYDESEAGYFDACMFMNGLQRASDPAEALGAVWNYLKENGVLLLVLPVIEGKDDAGAGTDAACFARGNNYFFDTKTIQSLLVKCGFGDIYAETLHRNTTFPGNIFSLFRTHAVQGEQLSERAGTYLVILARKQAKRRRPLLSIIMPVYNEARTFPLMYAALRDKKLGAADKEIIIVESNSTDGTRAMVGEVAADPCVKVLYEDSPMGKGHAVRAGLARAAGDFVAIQDGDLEYDTNDYDQLLEPLVSYREAFVLGSRHSKGWKMRHFGDQPTVSYLMNVGQSICTVLLNVFCGTSMKDPFTMYKLFRRDCLTGLSFHADRFDFDWEIVIKFIRKGYIPFEIPVNYRSRSFREGKKVSFLKDPLLWCVALVRFRFCRLYTKDRRY